MAGFWETMIGKMSDLVDFLPDTIHMSRTELLSNRSESSGRCLTAEEATNNNINMIINSY